MQSQRISDKAELSQNYGQTNPILTSRKQHNRLYAGYMNTKRFYGIKSSYDPFEIFNEFCSEVKTKETLEEVFDCLHALALNKLGYSFTAIALLNGSSDYLKIRLADHLGNIYSSKVFMNENDNLIIHCFKNKQQNSFDNVSFLSIPYFHSTGGIILPLIYENECLGVFVAGSFLKNQQNFDYWEILTNYLSLVIANKNLSSKSGTENIDSLTGLINHRELQEKLRLELEKSQSRSVPLSVIMLDINNISQVNREFGHSKGDEIIRLVSEKIKNSIRSSDCAGRYGGDEICLILPETGNQEAYKIAEYINYAVSSCMVDDVGLIKSSIGVATYPDCAFEQEKLLMLAEQAMFISKTKGYRDGNFKVVNSLELNNSPENSVESRAYIFAKKHSQISVNNEDAVKQFYEENLDRNYNCIEVVKSLAGAIDAKDPYTRGHSQCVSRYAEALARAVSLPEFEVEKIKLAAMLHDVGKIGIPEAILSKPGKLEDDEWEIMKQHPEIGVTKVLEPIHSIKDLIPIVRHHHEQWNGLGYPDKLSGENIPYGARIVAVADAFHALISDRPYRKALSIDTAIEILKKGAGIQWDVDLIRKFIIIAPSLSTSV